MKPGAAEAETTLLYIDYGSCGDTNLYMCWNVEKYIKKVSFFTDNSEKEPFLNI